MIVVEMVGSALRKGTRGVPIRLLVILTLGLLVIMTFGSTMGLRHREPKLRPMELIQTQLILLVCFVASYIIDCVMRVGIYNIGMVILVTCSGNVLQGILLGQ